MTGKAIKETHFHLPGQSNFYKGKVRDVYTIGNEFLVMVVTDRISAFDVVLPEPIPYKGQVLNQIAAKSLQQTLDIVPNWVIDVPDPAVTIGRICEPFKVEMVIRGYLAGHAWREYQAGRREVCGVHLPDGLIENQKLPEPIITPTTKAEVGHDEDISKDEIIRRKLVTQEDYSVLEMYTHSLFSRGTDMASERGLILVDTKYEFGKFDGRIHLIDEIHTPDSSRYFYREGYEELLSKNSPQRQLSKEFVRKWLIDSGFQGKEDQLIPAMTDQIVNDISDRYVELYQHITGIEFQKQQDVNLIDRIESNIIEALKRLK